MGVRRRREEESSVRRPGHKGQAVGAHRLAQTHTDVPKLVHWKANVIGHRLSTYTDTPT